MSPIPPLDAAVIGGGPAGLAAAIGIARACRTVALVDCERPGRSDYAQINHNYLGFPGGVAATHLRDLGREQAAHYGIRFEDAEASAVRRVVAGFTIEAPGMEL
ncbi:MAG: FAD-binding protein, partial [Thermomicrobiales bacterium]|nr:FAD-binding protein [Thermomicrobiales bacterium]